MRGMALLALLALACGGGSRRPAGDAGGDVATDGGPIDAGAPIDADPALVVDPAAAAGAVSHTATLLRAVGAGDGGATAGATYALIGAGSTVVSSTSPLAATATTGPLALVGECTCDPAGCVFVACGNDGGSYLLDGQITIDGDAHAIDLDVTVAAEGGPFDWELDGQLIASATAVVGELTGVGVGIAVDESGEHALGRAFGLDYAAIVLDEDGCPIDGTLSATARHERDGQLRFAGAGAVGFGPACGDTAVR